MAGEFSGDLGFKSESVLLDFYLLDGLPTKGFKSGFHVGEVEVRAHIGEKGKETISHAVPEIKNPVCRTS